ncbi:hypothetical protein CGLO_17815 [Colletotrichum gloeosporioides Cg-14]|uniref:Uncharacterized protein n=1 Tax=Colletotrichum gloeosporioides (strain Cg-14) TaxID=1237896 RepID=T0JVX7_COLGC|nr:hypothetical protein CGLO_17815 [Colletotrichum gloeosporioides Cg-14]
MCTLDLKLTIVSVIIFPLYARWQKCKGTCMSGYKECRSFAALRLKNMNKRIFMMKTKIS